MNLSFWIAVLFWAFFLGFLLGISFPDQKKPQKRSFETEIKDLYDFGISGKEYENFLNYDGTTQEKE